MSTKIYRASYNARIFVEICRDKCSNAFVNYRIYDLLYRDINYTKLNESCSSTSPYILQRLAFSLDTRQLGLPSAALIPKRRNTRVPRHDFRFFFLFSFPSFRRVLLLSTTRYHFSSLRGSSSFLFNPSTSCYNEIYTCTLAVVDNSNRMSRVCYDAKVSCRRVS